MIPILYAKTETSFTSNGIGRLVDCISCKVTEERNGIYELELDYPVAGNLFKEMASNGGIIGVIHDDNHDIQPFDIYGSSANIGGVVTFYARHISYRLNNIILSPYTASGIVAAVAGISTHSVNTNPFTFATDKTTSGTFTLVQPRSVRSALGGQEGSLLDVFGGGEWKFDKWTASLLNARGRDTGVTVRYGKNMTGLEQTTDNGGTFNAIAPYWTDGETTIYPDSVIVQPTTPITPVKAVSMDMSDQFESQPSKSELTSAARSYLDKNQPWIPRENIKVKFVALWKSLEYENVAEIQRVGLCDTVSIYWTDLGIVAEKAKVISVVYDVLNERLDEIEVGTAETSHVAIANSDGNYSAASGGSGVTPDDYIEEEGTSGIWSWRKWSSGVAECWGASEYTVNMTTVWTNPIYYANSVLQEALPSGLFITADECQYSASPSANQTGADCWASIASPYPLTASDTCGLYLLRIGSASNKKIKINWSVKGRWK